MKEYHLSKNVKTAYEKLRKAYLKEFKKTPGIFSSNKVGSLARRYILEQFPLEHYGSNIDGIVFEGWSLRSLLESAFAAGHLMGKDPQTWKNSNKKVKKLTKLLSSYRINLDRRNFHPSLVKVVGVEDDNVILHIKDGMRSDKHKEYVVKLEDYQKEKKRIEKLAKKVLAAEF